VCVTPRLQLGCVGHMKNKNVTNAMHYTGDQVGLISFILYAGNIYMEPHVWPRQAMKTQQSQETAIKVAYTYLKGFIKCFYQFSIQPQFCNFIHFSIFKTKYYPCRISSYRK
jgi:hypothetical protein